ncbi:MAG: FAD-dependent oxidoreductase [Halothermotrichaceae bacterium]
MDNKNVVVLGAGYGGIEAAKKLNKLLKKEPDVTITIINDNPYHTLLTELHEVAGNRIEEDGVKVDLGEIFNSTKVNIVVDYITDLDFKNKVLKSDQYEYNYDYLIIGTGSEPTHCGVEGVEENSFTLWSLDDAKEINKHIEECFRKARVTSDSNLRRELLSFAVCGGGFTGVEMLGELIEWFDQLCYEYGIPRRDVDLYLVEGLDKILPNIDDKLANKAMDYLYKKHVKVKLGEFVEKVRVNGLTLANGGKIDARTIIWNCGVRASDTAAQLNLESDKAGRIKVNKYLQTEYPEVYAIGDNAAAQFSTDNENILPALVEAALATGETAAVNIAADIKDKEKEEIDAKLHGIMVSIGGKFAVADVMGISLKGWPAMFTKHMVNMHYLFGVGGIKNGIGYILNYIEEQSSGKGLVAQAFGHFSQKSYSFWLAFLRIFLGYQWLVSGLDKVHNGWLTINADKIQGGLLGWLSAGDKLVSGASTSPIGPNPVGWYVEFMEAVVFPNAYLFQCMITLGELALAVSLILGIFVPLGAIGSTFMTVNFFLSGFYPQNVTLPWFLISSIACIGAGRSLSVDYYLLPWLKKIVWGRRKGKNRDLKKVVNSK